MWCFVTLLLRSLTISTAPHTKQPKSLFHTLPHTHTITHTEAEKFLLSESALDDIDLTDDQYALASNKNNKDIDFDALLEARMLDEVCMRYSWRQCY